jgi:hypothetical protein
MQSSVSFEKDTYRMMVIIILEENTKKNHKRVISLYVIEISLDSNKL